MLECPLVCDNCKKKIGYIAVKSMSGFLNLKSIACMKCHKNIIIEQHDDVKELTV